MVVPSHLCVGLVERQELTDLECHVPVDNRGPYHVIFRTYPLSYGILETSVNHAKACRSLGSAVNLDRPANPVSVSVAGISIPLRFPTR